MSPLTASLAQLAAHPLIHSLGWTLLHFCWQGAAVAFALWCVLGFMSGRSSQARYAAACLALGLMVALPIATFVHVAAAEYKERTAIFGPGVAIDADFVLTVGAYQAVQPWPARIGMALDHALPWVLLAWFAGVLVFACRLNFGLLVARRLKTATTEAPPPALLQLFEALRLRLGIQRAVQLLHSAQVQVPTVIGWLRPVVLLPASCLTGLSSEQIEAVLCHELAHVRRHDYLVSVLQSVIETVLFYHPAVWWVSKQVRRERECCCDQVAVANGGNVLAYARALSFLEENRAPFPEFVLGANGGVLKTRIQRLLGRRQVAESSQPAAFILLALVLIGAASYAVTVARAQLHSASNAAGLPSEPVIATPASQLLALNPAPGSFAILRAAQPQAASAANQSNGDASSSQPPNMYQTWLDQDVMWIISDSDAQQFQQLTTDTERARFIDQFWARYDPPGAPAGTYRAEHYQRIAYANQHFAAGAPGWTTDRGRTYIVNGSPESIEAHPSAGPGSAYPFEIWHYKAAHAGDPDLYLKFVDDSGNGRYRLTGQVPAPDTAAATQNAQATALQAALAERSPQPVPASAGVIQGNLIYKVDPVYPPIAKAAHVQGSVVLHARISKQGTIEDLHVISGAPMLTPSAIDAVRQWKYKPYTIAGEPAEVETTININFALSQPDLSCTYYDQRTVAHPGTCEESTTDKGTYSCRADDNKELVESQSGCEEKVKRLQDSQHDNPFTGVIQTSPTPAAGPPSSIGPAGPSASMPVRLAPASPPNGRVVLPGSDGTPVRKLGSGITPPMPIFKVEPELSPEASRAKFSGVVVVSLIVDANGDPQNVHVVRGAGMGLDEKAVEAIKRYKFKPAVEAGKPVPVEVNVEVNFRVADSPKPRAAVTPSGQAPVTEAAAQTPSSPSPAASPGFVPTQALSPQQYHGVPVRKIGGDVTAPLVVSKVDPEFTTEARQKKLAGVVLVNLIVDAKGKPQNVHVGRGIGSGLDQNAVAAVKKYKFEPATENGKPVPVALSVEVNFQIF